MSHAILFTLSAGLILGVTLTAARDGALNGTRASITDAHPVASITLTLATIYLGGRGLSEYGDTIHTLTAPQLVLSAITALALAAIIAALTDRHIAHHATRNAA